MLKWERRAKAARRGIVKLWPRIKKLQRELKYLEKVQLRLINTKWDAQREIVPVKIIPFIKQESGPKTHDEKLVDVVHTFSHMNSVDRARFMERLQGEL